LGDALRLQEQWDKAVGVYQDAIKEFPGEPDLHISLGWIYYERGDGARAAQPEFEKAIDLDKKAAEGYFAMGQLLFREKQFERADNYFVQALERAPNNRWYYLAHGDNARLAGDLTRAQEIYEQATTRFPDFDNAYYQLAMIYRSLNKPEKAVATIERAVELMDPPLDSYYAQAGEIYRWAGFEIRR
jgi:tetratricopeptide (TPR) repeat protein